MEMNSMNPVLTDQQKKALIEANERKVQLQEISTAPAMELILFYWEESGHFESGMMVSSKSVTGKLFPVLFNGESPDTDPTHWAFVSFKK